MNGRTVQNGSRAAGTLGSVAVMRALMRLGVPAHLKGYAYLRECITYVLSNPGCHVSVTKLLYPYAARLFNTSSAGVERAIRNAVEAGWEQGDLHMRQLLFGSLYSERKPKNSEFIATVADYIRLQSLLCMNADGLHNGINI